ncbi:hypothetical protein DFH09DRAFT_339215 [Mycena vulgaris]|nr:hypothetical protein DFH09DRAFT_339215 [Mycena vulgaris]
MPRPSTLLIGTLPVALLGIMYYEHRRLQASYPTLRVPPAFEISARRDKPAFGMSGLNGGSTSGVKSETWMSTHAGDMWTATVQRRLLSSDPDDAADGPLIVFARAFWSSWPLQIERRIVQGLARMGVLFQLRGGNVGPEEEHKFVNTARILGGLFVVEGQGPSVGQSSRGPLVTSWWLRPIELSDSEAHKPGVLGGYHSFAIEDNTSTSSSPTSGEEIPANDGPTVRLCFISHVILSTPSPTGPSSSVDGPPASSSIPSSEQRGLSLKQKIIMHFHVMYSRILLDLAVRELERGARVG